MVCLLTSPIIKVTPPSYLQNNNGRISTTTFFLYSRMLGAPDIERFVFLEDTHFESILRFSHLYDGYWRYAHHH